MMYQALRGPSAKDTDLVHRTKLTEQVEQSADSALRKLANELKVLCASLLSAAQWLINHHRLLQVRYP
jgi:hypothetical protein